jgi:ribosomal protein S3
LTILSAAGAGVTAPHAPDRSGIEALSMRLTEHLPSSRGNQFLAENLQRRVIDEFLSTELETAGYRGMDVAKTPTGTQFLIHVDARPSTVDAAPTPTELAAELDSRFGLEAPEIEIRAIE